jgi:hypothetical protein
MCIGGAGDDDGRVPTKAFDVGGRMSGLSTDFRCYRGVGFPRYEKRSCQVPAKGVFL